MRPIERVNLLDKIGRELQSRWTFSGIDEFLKACGIDTSKQTSDVNSKWVYSKELLADEPEEKLIEIADELGLEHGYIARQDLSISDSKFWKPGYFRLFISHISKHKDKAANLQRALLKYGISGFVAHEDIEPTKEWLVEIEKALLSMNALAAILTPGFRDSAWTDQEVGFAVGRDVLIIPIRHGLDPYGFIARYQGMQAGNRTVGEVARATHQILASNKKTKGLYANSIVRLTLEASTPEQAGKWIKILEAMDGVPVPALEYLQANTGESEIVGGETSLVDRINAVLRSAGVSEVTEKESSPMHFDDDEIPF